MQRLIVVYNPRSSQFIRVKTEVLEKLVNLKGFLIGKFEILKTNFDDNVLRLRKILKDGDLVLAVGGDATATIAANAILELEKDITLSVLPYGNFNDLARTLKMSKRAFEKVFFEARTATVRFYPLAVYINDEFWRYATCYVTIGMTAEAVKIFDMPKIRKKLQKGHKSSWRSYVDLAKWYFKNRHRKVFLPDFKLNGKDLIFKRQSDYAAVNGRSMARVMKGGDDYSKPKVFRSEVDKLTNFWRLFKLMTKSLLVRIPGKETTGDVLEFLGPATVELQAEGEYRTFEKVTKIEIKKTGKFLKVLEGKNE